MRCFVALGDSFTAGTGPDEPRWPDEVARAFPGCRYVNLARAGVPALAPHFRNLADLRYREGATIYLEVANAEQSLFNAQLAYVATQAQLFQSYANLYKAIGGGWVEEAERLTSRGD